MTVNQSFDKTIYNYYNMYRGVCQCCVDRIDREPTWHHSKIFPKKILYSLLQRRPIWRNK